MHCHTAVVVEAADRNDVAVIEEVVACHTAAESVAAVRTVLDYMAVAGAVVEEAVQMIAGAVHTTCWVVVVPVLAALVAVDAVRKTAAVADKAVVVAADPLPYFLHHQH